MRCSSYCTANSYNMHEIVQALIHDGLEPKYFDDVIHAQKEFHNSKKVIDIFYFPFGCVTIWGAEKTEEHNIISQISKFSSGEVSEAVCEDVYYKYDETSQKSYIDEESDSIILTNDSVFLKLSVSYALAQSAKLGILEKSVAQIISRTARIQQELATIGKVTLSKKEIVQQMGALFNERYSINMHSEILDTPEFFWRRPSYEPLYLATAEFQDIQVRQNIINRRLDLMQEVYSMLANELNHIHSSRMEMIIIVLITMEVIMGLSHSGIMPKLLSIFGIYM